MKIKFKRITALFAALAIMITALPLTIIPISAAGTDGESTEYAMTDTLSSVVTGS